MNTILVPTDFSEHAQHASDFAAQLAQQCNAELCFIHVVEIPGVSETEHYLNHLLINDMMAAAEENLQELSRQYKHVRDVKTFVTTSNAVSGIKKGILSMQADFIVMGKHAPLGLIADLLFDNNAEKIIRYANCPVFSIANKVDLSKWKKAIIAVDPESIHDDMLHEVEALTKDLSLTPHFIWVAKNLETHASLNVSLLKDALQAHFGSGTFEFSSIVNGDPATGILELTKKLHGDLIMLATHARSGLQRIIQGSVTEKVIEKSETPTLVVRLLDKQLQAVTTT